MIKYTLLIAAILLALSSQLRADDDQAQARSLVESGTILPLEVILQNARSYQPGRILEVELEHEDDRYLYEIELLDNKGNVWELKLDAQSGQLLETKQEH